MRLNMRIEITYFDMEGKKAKILSTNVDEIEELMSAAYQSQSPIAFPGDVIYALKKLRKVGGLPGTDERRIHLVVRIEMEDSLSLRMIPYNELEEYSDDAMRTYADLGSELKNNLHMVSGLSTEANELLNVYKAELAYDRTPDRTNINEEVGDLLWFLVNYARINNISLPSAMERNISKLKVRYPEKFDKKRAIVRDLKLEAEALTVGDMKTWQITHSSKGYLGSFSGKNEAEALQECIACWPILREDGPGEFTLKRFNQ